MIIGKKNLRSYASTVKNSIRDCAYRMISPLCKPNSNPVLVFGNPKSGTTIVGYLLSKALDKTYTPDLVRAIPSACLQFHLEYKFYNTKMLIDKYRYEFSRDVIKEPILTYYAEDFVNYFHNAKFVFVVRDPRDNIRSILNRLKIPGHYADIELDKYEELNKTPAWKLLLDNKWKLGESSGSYVEVLAYYWMDAFKQYKKNQDKYILLKYEDFCTDKVKSINLVCKSLGFDVKKNISKYVDIQKQSRGDSSVNLKKYFGSRNLDKIETICKEGIEFMGYQAKL